MHTPTLHTPTLHTTTLRTPVHSFNPRKMSAPVLPQLNRLTPSHGRTLQMQGSSSAHDFGSTRERSGAVSVHPLPRFYSQHESILQQIEQMDGLEEGMEFLKPGTVKATKSEEVIEFSSVESEMRSESSAMIGFVAAGAEAKPSCSSSFDFPSEDPCYEKALSECHTLKESEAFQEGVLLKCIDHKPLYPYMHFAHFHHPSHPDRQREINKAIRACSVTMGGQYGGYDEVYSIQKTAASTDPRLPTSRHAGYIAIGFKLLDDQSRQAALERTWLSWTGAREIYKYSPRTWNLRRISLHRHPVSTRNGLPRPFVYVLLCEFGSILHPSNTIQALDFCERLRVRNCGHIALYQVHSSYSSAPPPPSRPSSTTMSPRLRAMRNPMMRGLSQDVEPSTQDRRSKLLRARERSFNYTEEEHYYPNY